jgi:MerR family regulatory protein
MPLLSIGEFARRTRLTPKALRIYDRIGLLSPAAIDEIGAVLAEGADPMFEIETRHVPAQRLMSIQRRLHAPGDRRVRPRGEGHVRRAPRRRATDGSRPRSAAPDHVQPSEAIGVRTEPEHDEAYTTITKAQWAYPAILAADDLICDVAFPY